MMKNFVALSSFLFQCESYRWKKKVSNSGKL